MGRRAITREVYETMVEAFRDAPGNRTQVARVCRVDRETARKAWESGWPNKGFAPIAQVLEDEKEAARARRVELELQAQREEDERRLKARQDAIDARAQEGVGAKASRTNALNMAIVTAKLVKVANRVADELELRTAQGMAGFSVHDMKRMVDTASLVAHRSAVIFQHALQIERIVSGEPIAVVGLRIDKMTPDQMVTELEGLERTMRRARQLDEARVLDGELVREPDPAG